MRIGPRASSDAVRRRRLRTARLFAAAAVGVACWSGGGAPPPRLSAAAAVAVACGLAAVPARAHAAPAWTTYHRDAGRSGYDPEATSPIVPVLAWRSVDLGAPIFQQPLILGSRADIATVGNDIYALDTPRGAAIWSTHA